MEFEPFPEPLPGDPLEILDRWLAEAVASLGAEHRNPTAMTLATSSADAVPDARIVLCRGFDSARGVLTYFTDRSSAKGRQQVENPRAAVVFYWESLYRQVRAAGPVCWTPDADSDAYFATRMAAAQASAAASFQSQPLGSRQELEERQAAQLRESERTGKPLPRPERWGGVQIWIERLEFWTGRTDRLHDRVLYLRTLEPIPSAKPPDFKASDWIASRLQP